MFESLDTLSRDQNMFTQTLRVDWLSVSEVGRTFQVYALRKCEKQASKQDLVLQCHGVPAEHHAMRSQGPWMALIPL